MTEILVIAVVAIIVVGPKDLPGLLRTGAKYVGQLRSMARDFQGQIKEAVKDSELEDLHNDFKGISEANPASKIEDEVSDYLNSDDAYDQPDEDYIAAGEKMAAEKSATASSPKKLATAKTSTTKPPEVKKPAARKPAAKKASAKKTAAQKSAARKPSASKPAAKKPAARKSTAKKPVAAQKPAAKRAASTTSS